MKKTFIIFSRFGIKNKATFFFALYLTAKKPRARSTAPVTRGIAS